MCEYANYVQGKQQIMTLLKHGLLDYVHLFTLRLNSETRGQDPGVTGTIPGDNCGASASVADVTGPWSRFATSSTPTVQTTSSRWPAPCFCWGGTSWVGQQNTSYYSYSYLFLLGDLVLITSSFAAIEAYKQAENRSEAPDWEICHNLGRHQKIKTLDIIYIKHQGSLH